MKQPLRFAAFILILALGSSHLLLAQEIPSTQRHTVRLGYGAISIQRHGFIDFMDAGSGSTEQVTGPFNLSYVFTFAKFVQVGLTGSLVNRTETFNSGDLQHMRKETLRSIAVMPQLGFIWKTTEKWSAYSNYMVGLNFWKESKSAAGFPIEQKQDTNGEAYQLNLIGVTYGKKVRGFAEFGVGIVGIVNGGISIGF